jgi:hypothetical protein
MHLTPVSKGRIALGGRPIDRYRVLIQQAMDPIPEGEYMSWNGGPEGALPNMSLTISHEIYDTQHFWPSRFLEDPET